MDKSSMSVSELLKLPTGFLFQSLKGLDETYRVKNMAFIGMSDPQFRLYYRLHPKKKRAEFHFLYCRSAPDDKYFIKDSRIFILLDGIVSSHGDYNHLVLSASPDVHFVREHGESPILNSGSMSVKLTTFFEMVDALKEVESKFND